MDKEYRIKQINHLIAYIKHITTLSTGSVVILATFTKDVFPNHSWGSLMVTAIAGFMLSILASTVLYTFTITFEGPVHLDSKNPVWAENLAASSLILTWLGFLVGILALGTFAIINSI
jgi:hypothetical protein